MVLMPPLPMCGMVGAVGAGDTENAQFHGGMPSPCYCTDVIHGICPCICPRSPVCPLMASPATSLLALLLLPSVEVAALCSWLSPVTGDCTAALCIVSKTDMCSLPQGATRGSIQNEPLIMQVDVVVPGLREGSSVASVEATQHRMHTTQLHRVE